VSRASGVLDEFTAPRRAAGRKSCRLCAPTARLGRLIPRHASRVSPIRSER
jgi:hypothetical protein